MKNLLLMGGVALCAPLAASAGTCAAPEPLQSHYVTAASTCGGEIGIDMGGTVYGHPSQVYSVHVDHAADPLSHISFLQGANREASLTTSCTSAPIQIAATGVLDIDLQPLSNGDYLLVVSTDPSIPVQNPPVCGDFAITAGTLPVSLQSFSIE